VLSRIYFDLETSDKIPIGQILNYSFLFDYYSTNNSASKVREESYQPLELSGKIKLSRVQLPSPSAILANRADHALKLDQEDLPEERQALVGIANYINEALELSEEGVFLIGYNSQRFDTPYLRTSFIRNGINPYFNFRLYSLDAYQYVRKLAVNNQDFPQIFDNNQENQQASLSLENVAKHFGILKGSQIHESSFDAKLLRKLILLLEERFKSPLHKFKAYQPANNYENGEIVFRVQPKTFQLKERQLEVTPYLHLRSNARSALWVDLEQFRKKRDKSALRNFSFKTSEFFLAKDTPIISNELNKLRVEALELFKTINQENRSRTKALDIEADIYRLELNKLNFLSKALWENDARLLRSSNDQDLLELYDRFRINYYKFGGKHDQVITDRLRAYYEYRYRSKMIVSEESNGQPSYHPKLEDWKLEAEMHLSTRKDESDQKLMRELLELYKQSYFSSFY
jgi:hypothetical protein